jgi:hypothetical protein
MSARAVHVRIGRLVVDAPLRGEAAQWGDAIERALHAQLARAPAIDGAASVGGTHPPEVIAQHIARRANDAAPSTNARPSGARSGRA